MAANFDFSNGYVALRLLCGGFLIPHAIGKFTAKDASIGFFNGAGLRPARLWWGTAMAIEWSLGLALIFGLATAWAALGAAAYLLIAATANYKVSRRWLWHIGGSEWPVFWALCCLVVGVYGAPAGA